VEPGARPRRPALRVGRARLPGPPARARPAQRAAWVAGSTSSAASYTPAVTLRNRVWVFHGRNERSTQLRGVESWGTRDGRWRAEQDAPVERARTSSAPSGPACTPSAASSCVEYLGHQERLPGLRRARSQVAAAAGSGPHRASRRQRSAVEARHLRRGLPGGRRDKGHGPGGSPEGVVRSHEQGPRLHAVYEGLPQLRRDGRSGPGSAFSACRS
jgi:hypothetical protein